MDKKIKDQLTIVSTIVKRLQIEDFVVSESLSVFEYVRKTSEYSFEDSLTITEIAQEPLPYLFTDTLEITELKTMNPAIRNYDFLDPLTVKEYRNHYLNV